MNRHEFISTFAPTVKKYAKGTGLFPSLFMAQAILESSDNKGIPGNSSLAKKHFNYFGVKADKNWPGQKAILKTREVINGKNIYVDAAFRKYSNPEQSFRDRVNFLLSNSRYKNAGVFNAQTPEQQATLLQKAKYATDPRYSEILIDLIDSLNLKALD